MVEQLRSVKFKIIVEIDTNKATYSKTFSLDDGKEWIEDVIERFNEWFEVTCP